MSVLEDDLTKSSALVIDANPTSRSILVAQLRELGIGTVNQTSRVTDGRRMIEMHPYDFVICEQNFPSEAMTGQELLDDLRRFHLLPYSTVFLMFTAEATYVQVAEAAESALDGYLLKPHKATQLRARLNVARERKRTLMPIFSAIDFERYEEAAELCLQRFHSKETFWLYAARVGAELMLQLEKPDQALELYQAVIAARDLNWAKLGVARAQLDAGQVQQSINTLDMLIGEDSSYVDAYDLMARAQFEMGKFDEALQTYKTAAAMTPDSIPRLQSVGMMSFYQGQLADAEKLLDRTVRIGLDSKMFDPQTLVLLAFIRLGQADRKALQRCLDDCNRLQEKSPDDTRLRSLSRMVNALVMIGKGQTRELAEEVKTLKEGLRHSDFDVEQASNFISLLAQMAQKNLTVDAATEAIEAVGMRFCSNRAITELLVSSASTHPPYAEQLRQCQSKVLEQAEVAMALVRSGNPTAAIKNLLIHGKESLNSRLIDNAWQLFIRNQDTLEDAENIAKQATTLHNQYGQSGNRATLGEPRRPTGSIALRTSKKPA